MFGALRCEEGGNLLLSICVIHRAVINNSLMDLCGCFEFV